MDYNYKDYQCSIQTALGSTNADYPVKDNRFDYQENNIQAASYPGYSIMAMIHEDESSGDFHHILSQCYDKLLDLHERCGLFVLPKNSWHSTIANLLSAEKYRKKILEAGLLPSFLKSISRAFLALQPKEGKEISIKLEGFGFMKTCIVAYYSIVEKTKKKRKIKRKNKVLKPQETYA